MSPKVRPERECRSAQRQRRPASITVSVSIDVANLAQGVAFYCAFGFSRKAGPIPGVAGLAGPNMQRCLLERTAGRLISTRNVR